MENIRSLVKGISGFLALMGVYFLILTLVSGWDFTVLQFRDFWYYIIPLAGGFGIQVGLYSYIKSLVHSRNSKVVAVSGTTSTMAMISCCAHYLVNLLPVLAVSGIATFVAQYQIQLFWVGLAFNAFGIILMVRRTIKISKHQ